MSAVKAMYLARTIYTGRLCPITGTPLESRVAETVGVVTTLAANAVQPHILEMMVAATWLSSALEASHLSFQDIKREFGFDVAVGVQQMEHMTHTARAGEVEKLRAIVDDTCEWVQNIMCALFEVETRRRRCVLFTTVDLENKPKIAEEFATHINAKHLLLDNLTTEDTEFLHMARSSS